MAYVVAVVCGLVFGAGAQYLGTLDAAGALGTWTWTVSGMSAPWLVLPFVAGATQDRVRRAAAIGLVVTLSALAGYFAMTHSPVEGAPLAEFGTRVTRMVTTGNNPLWIAGGLVTGPLFGLLGCRWRTRRAWTGAASVVLALCLEPSARSAVALRSGSWAVWLGEIAVGLLAAIWFSRAILGARRAARLDGSARAGA